MVSTTSLSSTTRMVAACLSLPLAIGRYRSPRIAVFHGFSLIHPSRV
jgi:hypothetical protein